MSRKERQRAAKQKRIEEASIRVALGFSKEKWNALSEAKKDEIKARFNKKVEAAQMESISP
jgi:hypothetical protein